jgi:hypothetical protein
MHIRNITVLSALYLLPGLSMAANINYVLTDNSYYSYSYADWGGSGDIITDKSQLTGFLQVNIDDSFTTVTIDYSNVLLNGSSFRTTDTLFTDITAISSGTLISGFTGEYDYISYGNATLSPFPFLCVECGYKMTLNPFSNSLVLSYHESNPYDTGEVDFELFVSQVPLPAAVWLFGSGLIGLISIARRKKT